MKRKNEESYTTGEFARYFGIKKDTLLYYDKIGLFSPAGVRPNGYRYYTPAQVEAFGALRSLREMNVPIQEIREYFGSPTPARLKEMAAKQAEKLQEQQTLLQFWMKKRPVKRKSSVPLSRNISVLQTRRSGQRLPLKTERLRLIKILSKKRLRKILCARRSNLM